MMDSGNGAYLLFKVDLPNDDASTNLVKRCLQALDLRFSDPIVTIDTAVHNAARLLRVPGTLNAKGDDMPDRPHRLARVVKTGDTGNVVPHDLLVQLAAGAPETPHPGPSPNGHGGSFDVGRWIDRHHVGVASSGTYAGGRKWILLSCPWNPTHTNRSAYIIQFPSGGIAAGCLHNGCRRKGWHDLRDAVEPGWRERRSPSGADSANSANTASADEVPWELPIPFQESSLPPFPTETLPGWLKQYVEELATATQTPPDLPAMVVLSVVSAAVAKKVEVEVKLGYTEPVTIYMVIAMEPGNRKSAVFGQATSPLQEYEEEEAQRLAPEIAEAQTNYKIAEARLKKIQEAAASATADGRPACEEEASQLARGLAAIQVPTPPRMIADDISPERVATLLQDNNGRLGILSPEGDIFDLMAGRYSSGTPNLGVFLKGHAGDTLRVDRVGRPPEYVRTPALTIGLTVQPEVLRGLIEKPGFRGRGLLGRFFYSLPTSLLGRRNVNAPPMSAGACHAYHDNVRALLALPFHQDGERNVLPHRLALTPASFRTWQEFEEWLEPLLGQYGHLGHMTDWAGKLAGGVARLAGLLHAAKYAKDAAPWLHQVDAETMELAIRIGSYLLEHARAAYAEMGADPIVEDARFVLGWIVKKGVETLTLRDIFESTKGRFKKVKALEPALALLIEHGFMREVAAAPRPGPGRKPSPTRSTPMCSPPARTIRTMAPKKKSSSPSVTSRRGGASPVMIHDFLADLHQRGLRAMADGPDIVIRGPQEALTPELIETIKARKPELLTVLTAQGLLDRLLDLGATFEVMGDDLIWFGPTGTVTPEVRAEVAQLKREIITLLRAGYPRSRRTWGEPTWTDWGKQAHDEVEP
jgi:replicative DNA helicase